MECMGAGRQKDTEARRKIEGEIGRETGADRDRESGQNGETGGNTTQAQTSTQTCTAYAGEHSMCTHGHAASILQFPTTPLSAPMLFHLFDQAIAFSGQLPHRIQELTLPDPCKKCVPAAHHMCSPTPTAAARSLHGEASSSAVLPRKNQTKWETRFTKDSWNRHHIITKVDRFARPPGGG